MSRRILSESRIHAGIRKKIADFQTDVLRDVEAAIATNSIVVVGTRENPVAKKVRKLLSDAGLPYKYVEYGSYFRQAAHRLALKMWTGWPTFPMVFVNGALVGGYDELAELIGSGELASTQPQV